MIGWAIVLTGAVATLWSIGAAIYWTLRPGETDPRHPKYSILRSDR